MGHAQLRLALVPRARRCEHRCTGSINQDGFMSSRLEIGGSQIETHKKVGGGGGGGGAGRDKDRHRRDIVLCKGICKGKAH